MYNSFTIERVEIYAQSPNNNALYVISVRYFMAVRMSNVQRYKMHKPQKLLTQLSELKFTFPIL